MARKKKLKYPVHLFFLLGLVGGIGLLCISSQSHSQTQVLGEKTNKLQLQWFLPQVATPTPRPPTQQPVPTGLVPTISQQVPISQPFNPSGPPTKRSCGMDSPKTPDCECPPLEIEGYCYFCPDSDTTSAGSCYLSGPGVDEKTCRQQAWCLYKPVIYLYPTTPMRVDVAVATTGRIVISDPLYPGGGWKGVYAHPDGTLQYKNAFYHELFYETDVKTLTPPQTGYVITTSHLTEELSDFVSKMGLIAEEKQEFLDFWVPKLQSYNKPYIMVSLIPSTQKDTIDRLAISPAPDTLIQFTAYFKPLDTYISLPSFQFPHIPNRKGFTVVEWGGTIDEP